MAIQSSLLTTSTSAISPDAITANGKEVAITVMLFCNLNTPDPLDVTVGRQYLDIYLVKNGELPDSLNGSNKIANQMPVDAGDTFTFSTERIVLASGDRVYAKTTTNNQVSVTISYVLI